MKLTLEVNNTTAYKVSEKILKDVFESTLGSAGLACGDDKELELSLALVGEDEMQKLNARYRKKEKPTDVLSFFEYENIKDICSEKKKNIFLGELILCPTYIERSAKEDGETFEYAFYYITSHGILHLLGLPHGKKMFALQKGVADKITNKKI